MRFRPLLRWFDNQGIMPADAVLVMLKTIRFAVHVIAEDDAEKEREGCEMVVRMFNGLKYEARE